MVAELKVMGVKGLPGKSGSDKFYKPSQDNLALEKYPLSRDLYIVNSQGGGGLGLGFAASPQLLLTGLLVLLFLVHS